jgi:D-lactate dehydrogenase (cytochrome)
MASHRVRARSPKGDPRSPAAIADVVPYLKDAAQTPGGFTPRVAAPQSEAELAWALAEAPAVLAVGAQSSLTGGATPFGEWVLSLARMADLGGIQGRSIEVQAGVPLLVLEEHLRAHGLRYPPVPTFRGAFSGGVASTNAAGAATFKYGTTRDWVLGLTVVLASGDVLDLVRGDCLAHPDGFFEVELRGGEVRRVEVPTYVMPKVKKRSAGYFAAPGMDLVDLFVGSEGTLGVIASLRLGLLRDQPRATTFLQFASEALAIEATGRLREESERTWSSKDRSGLDVASIELMDRRCLGLLREDGTDVAHGVPLGEDVGAALLAELELEEGEDPWATAERLVHVLRDLTPQESVLFAPPEDRRRALQLEALREAVPMAVNHRIARLQKTAPGVHKAASDMVVPFSRIAETMAFYREGFSKRGLDHALWGHVSDGNVHANVIPRSYEDVQAAEEAILEFGDFVAGLNGCPLSEHGVGRSPVKQELLRRLYGAAGIDQMRHVKAAFDPLGKLAPGVLFPVKGTEPARVG